MTPTFQARPVVAPDMPHCALGEGITWSPSHQALFWTDITGCVLWRYHPARQQLSHWRLPDRLGSFALTHQPQRLLCAFAHHLAWLDLHTGRTHTLQHFDDGLPTRANDGRCDRHGHFVFGTLDEAGGPQAQGQWWRMSASGGLQALPLPPVRIPNGLAFSPDGQRLYFCDSADGRLRCAQYDPATGGITQAQVLATVPAGEPDGATVDAHGHYWSAHWSAGVVLGYTPEGQVMARVELPASQPSCVAFGGPDLKTLYITTARVGLSPEQLAQQTHAGRLFEVALPWQGLPEPLFGSTPPTRL